MATVYQPGIPVPSFTQGPNFPNDPELMYSMAGYTQKGVTLAGGQGILPIGTVLARRASDKLYVVYDNGGSGGVETAVGILRRGVDTTAGPVQANIVIKGIVKNSLVSGADSAAITELNARVDAPRDIFSF